jgi:predicted HNH restriction endonuclease
MIPKEITREHLLVAIRRLDRKPREDRFESKRYDLVHLGKPYPPKQVIRGAMKLAVGRVSENFSGGAETNKVLAKHGFVIVGKNGKLLAAKPQEEEDERAFMEGKQVFRRHLSRERNRKAVLLAKEQRLREKGDLCCDVCDFSFVEMYGAHGVGFIEAHHDVAPISDLKKEGRIKPSELALVCSNCHRMLHRSRPWMSVKQLRKRIGKEKA